MRLQDWLDQTSKQIPRTDAELIALRFLAPEGVDKSWLVAHGDFELTPEQVQTVEPFVVWREASEPLAYILGEKEFYGRKFRVSPEVLIPRPETEVLIDLIRELPLPKQASFLDMGTGSGCIAITLALEFPQSTVLATDTSVRALEMAFDNDTEHEGRVDFLQSDLFSRFRRDEGHFDVLVANLPYVDPTWDWLDKRALSYEPASALYVAEEGGLALYRRLFAEIREYQAKDDYDFDVDYVVVEADPCQHEALARMAKAQKFELLKTQGFGLVFRA